ncbi:hypothetical protein J7M22_12035 [Candidatus Poribacteria bacterium]|nr:hypothetical protein [Candidatus Poribacteria bacterium]
MNVTRRSFLKQALATLSGIALTQYLGADPVEKLNPDLPALVRLYHFGLF